ncbi:15077_t:CDS:1 [Cetraspora pellucida]|uniref:15077_t:CDS:1 n=1 Tax=Cetraspora pellucida TaxID=1433469 RepID=A0A9N9EYF4_9GLOM|nr:15077_t:CDS:1 [Cetraspora pellucida]
MDNKDSILSNKGTSESPISCLTNNTAITSSVDTNQIKVMNKRGGSRRRSWVWDHFKLLPTICGTKGQCDELKNDGTKCNHIIKTDGDTEILATIFKVHMELQNLVD